MGELEEALGSKACPKGPFPTRVFRCSDDRCVRLAWIYSSVALIEGFSGIYNEGGVGAVRPSDSSPSILISQKKVCCLLKNFPASALVQPMTVADCLRMLRKYYTKLSHLYSVYEKLTEMFRPIVGAEFRVHIL